MGSRIMMKRADLSTRAATLCLVALCLAAAAGLAACDEEGGGSVGMTEDPDRGGVEPGDVGAEPEPVADADGVDGAAVDAGSTPDAASGPPAPVEVEPCVSTVMVGDLEVFAYEASRVDATADSAGFDESAGICSQPGVLPWTGVTWPDASRICMAHGFRLCTNEEWQSACSGLERLWGFPYSPGHQPAQCNDHVSGAGALEPTGARETCRTPEGAYDMSGNVWELTFDGAKRGASWKLNAVMFRIDAARCDMFYDVNEGFADDDVGFRCCR